MSSVPESKRGPRKLEVATKARDLAIYTIKICNNKNVFKPEYQSAMTDDIIRTAKDIFIDVWTANSIRVQNQGDWEAREALQKRAIRNCNNLLSLIQMAQPLFHLKTKRIKYWGGNTLEVRDKIKTWRESDRKRYREQLKQGNHAEAR